MPVPKTKISEEGYLEQEGKAEYKSEFYNGEIFAMAGATKEHNKIVASVVAEMYNFLRGKDCFIFPSDLRLHNVENSLYTYPDVTVVCGEEKYLDDNFDTLTNPTILIEVLSPATEDYDRGTKFKLYRSIPSLQNYIIVSSTEYAAEAYTRNNDKWILTTAKGKDGTLYISAIDYMMRLSDVYAQLPDFPAK